MELRTGRVNVFLADVTSVGRTLDPRSMFAPVPGAHAVYVNPGHMVTEAQHLASLYHGSGAPSVGSFLDAAMAHEEVHVMVTRRAPYPTGNIEAEERRATSVSNRYLNRPDRAGLGNYDNLVQPGQSLRKALRNLGVQLAPTPAEQLELLKEAAAYERLAPTHLSGFARLASWARSWTGPALRTAGGAGVGIAVGVAVDTAGDAWAGDDPGARFVWNYATMPLYMNPAGGAIKFTEGAKELIDLNHPTFAPPVEDLPSSSEGKGSLRPPGWRPPPDRAPNSGFFYWWPWNHPWPWGRTKW